MHSTKNFRHVGLLPDCFLVEQNFHSKFRYFHFLRCFTRSVINNRIAGATILLTMTWGKSKGILFDSFFDAKLLPCSSSFLLTSHILFPWHSRYLGKDGHLWQARTLYLAGWEGTRYGRKGNGPCFGSCPVPAPSALWSSLLKRIMKRRVDGEYESQSSLLVLK